jgi:molecular chaperone HtpG
MVPARLYKVAVNSNHPLIDRILKTEDESTKTALAKQAFDSGIAFAGAFKRC